MTQAVVSRKADEGIALWMLGGLYEVKLSGEETDGELTVVEMTVPVGMGPPPHTHPGGETVYVLEGKLTYHINGDTVEGGPGSVFYLPKGTLEFFQPEGDKPVRVLVIYTPGGIDRFFTEVAEKAPSRIIPPTPTEPPDLERLVRVAATYGMEIQPPPT